MSPRVRLRFRMVASAQYFSDCPPLVPIPRKPFQAIRERLSQLLRKRGSGENVVESLPKDGLRHTKQGPGHGDAVVFLGLVAQVVVPPKLLDEPIDRRFGLREPFGIAEDVEGDFPPVFLHGLNDERHDRLVFAVGLREIMKGLLPNLMHGMEDGFFDLGFGGMHVVLVGFCQRGLFHHDASSRLRCRQNLKEQHQRGENGPNRIAL